MNAQTLLTEALKERFKINATIEALQKHIEKTAERNIFKQYENQKVFRYGREYQLLGVDAILSTYSHGLEDIENVEVELAYVCTSKLPKIKRERLEEVKAKYAQTKRLDFNNYTVPIWFYRRYYVELTDVINNTANLNIS